MTSLFVQEQTTCDLVDCDLLVIEDYLLTKKLTMALFIHGKNLAVYFLTENCSFFVMRLPCLSGLKPREQGLYPSLLNLPVCWTLSLRPITESIYALGLHAFSAYTQLQVSWIPVAFKSAWILASLAQANHTPHE